MRKLIASILAVGSFSVAYAAQQVNLFEKQTQQEIRLLNEKIQKLYKLHVRECAPAEIAKAEAFIDAVDGLVYIDPDTGTVVKTGIKPIDKILYKNKAKKYIALAREKVYSDQDGDGIPCYQEIEQGTNPFEPEKKVSMKDEEEESGAIAREQEKKRAGYEPLKMHARIHFDFDRYNIKKDYLPYLNVIARYLKANKELKIKIVGYTDSIGSKEYNDRLARKRAESIKKYLVDHGISPDRIEIIGKGKEDYLFDINTPLNRFTNRRAEFFVMEPVEGK